MKVQSDQFLQAMQKFWQAENIAPHPAVAYDMVCKHHNLRNSLGQLKALPIRKNSSGIRIPLMRNRRGSTLQKKKPATQRKTLASTPQKKPALTLRKTPQRKPQVSPLKVRKRRISLGQSKVSPSPLKKRKRSDNGKPQRHRISHEYAEASSEIL